MGPSLGNATASDSAVPGGRLEIDARRIELATFLRSDGGSITLATKGASNYTDDGIILKSSGRILAHGTANTPGGSVNLFTDYADASGAAQSGTIDLNAGSVIDVSAGAQGDAGIIRLIAPRGGVTLGGTLSGAANGGKGGSIVVHTYQVDGSDATKPNTDITNLLSVISNGGSGFIESVDVEALTGDMTIAAGITAHHVKLAADGVTSGGNIDVNGSIIAAAEGPNGGVVELYAKNALTIDGSIRAVSMAGTSLDPNVLLSSTQGPISINGTIDVNDNTGSNASGIVYLRAQWNAAKDDINAAFGATGAIKGQSAVYAEAFSAYDASTTTLSSAYTDAKTFFGNYASNTNGFGYGRTNYHLLPGIELDSAGDMNWNTGSDPGKVIGARFNGESGVLTLRAAGNLVISASLVDNPTPASDLNNLLDQTGKNNYDFFARKSWGFNLIAGADSSSADYLATVRGQGDLKLLTKPNSPKGAGSLVYTESAPINFASGNDAIIGAVIAPQYMINNYIAYNLASYTGSIHGNISRDLIINGGAIQTATGNIEISAGRDLLLNIDGISNTYLGAIRTTGRLSSTKVFGQDSLDPVAPLYTDPATGRNLTLGAIQTVPSNFYWRYLDGGDITIDVGRSTGQDTMKTAQSPGQWDTFTALRGCLSSNGKCGALGSFTYKQFSANYGGLGVQASAGFVTMGGGNLSISAGADFLAQAGTFGDGDFTLRSGGDIRGRFVNRNGREDIRALGNFGSADERVQIELFKSNSAINALGDMQIGAIVNPDLASGDIRSTRNDFVKCSYDPDTSISLKAGENVTIEGKASYYYFNNTTDKDKMNEIVLPATVGIDAGGDINLLNNFTLASSPHGGFRLVAGGDISGSYSGINGIPPVIMMSDIAPEYWYGLFYVRATDEGRGGGWINDRTSRNTTQDGGKTQNLSYNNRHGFYKNTNAQLTAAPLHNDDPEPVVISANGDIKDLILYLAKKAEITAKRDISDIIYEGQNIHPDDISFIKAGNNISMKYVKGTGATTDVTEPLHKGLVQGGPGTFLIQAGNSIDLGTLQDGIKEVGSGNNAMLETGASKVIVLSGYDPNMNLDPVKFFNEIRDSGDLYGMLLSGGKQEGAESLVKRVIGIEAKDALDRLRVKAGSEEAFYKMLTAGGNADDAQALLDDTRTRTIGLLKPTSIDAGDINMTSSQIATSFGKSDIYVISNHNVNLGQTALPTANTVSKSTGITASGGGDVNIFARTDVNVQESRVMTFFSREDAVDPATAYGDITVWSDDGNINAGRGAKTAVSAKPPRKVKSPTGGYVSVFEPPAVGSGIRAATYGVNPPDPGNIHLFAPSGIIDASEAGIAGGSIFLAALQINNAANISFAAGAVGVPQTGTGVANIGAMSGSNMVAQGSQLTSEASGLAAAKAQASQMIEDIMAKWLEVKVIDFVQDDNEGGEKKP